MSKIRKLKEKVNQDDCPSRKSRLNHLFSLKVWGGWLAFSFLLTISVEATHRFSIEEGIWFLKNYPFPFFLNWMIISATLLIMMILSRKWVSLVVVSTSWLVLALGNGVISQFRGTPFMFSDFFLVKEGLSVAGSYLDVKLISLLAIALIIVAMLLIKTMKLKQKPKCFDYLFSGVHLLTVVIFMFLVYKNSWLEPINWDYATSYKQQGFAYSFLNTIYPYLEQGVEGYSKQSMQNIQSRMIEKEDETDKQPNIIYLQLESFMDPMEFEGVTYSYDPIPTFRMMTEKLGGRMNAPTYGGGTVRTEFEVLTGMDLDLMKPGEIPNNQLLRTTAVQSMASYLTEKGYSSTAIHNFQGSFYNRDAVYGNLGFQTFIPLEFMLGEEYIEYVTHTDDSMLVDYIIKALESSQEQRDFIFAVSTGPHGPYEDKEGYDDFPLQVVAIEEESYEPSLQDLIIRYWKLDQQLKRLIDYIDNLEEETVLVAYSDHYPIISILDDDSYFKQKDTYSVRYGIYANFELEPVELEEEIEAYQLSTYVFELIGMSGGVMNTIHRSFAEQEDYYQIKRLVQHDLLEGEQHLYDESNKPEPKNVTLGMNEIKATEGFITGTTLIVNGENFNPYTYIWLNGKKMQKPSFLATTQLAVDISQTNIKTIDDIKTIEIGQVGRYDKRIGPLIEVSVKR